MVGDITGEDLYNVLPFNNTVDKVLMTGQSVKDLLESYVVELCPDGSCRSSTFLQMSGIKVVYDIKDGNEGERVRKDTLCHWHLNII